MFAEGDQAMRLAGCCCIAGLVLVAACAGRGTYTVATATDPEPAFGAAGDDTTRFAGALAVHGRLPAAEQAAARAEAQRIAASWRDFEREAREDFDSHFRHWYYREYPATMDHLGIGLPNAIFDLQEATGVDPSFAEAWGALGRLTLEAGDLASARRYLDNARMAARTEAAAGRPLDPAVQLRICRDRAWALRDLALWDEGLVAADEGLALRRGDPELTLVKGLLLADAGRYQEAVQLAARMPALEYPRYDFIYRGFKQQTSAFANNWIRAQALLARGQVADAYWMLGDLDLYAYRGLLPFAPRYWRDAGLIAELHGDPKACLYYAVGYVTRPYQNFYPVSAHSVAPQVLDLPDERMPVFLGFGLRYYVGGSPLVYVGTQLNSMAMAYGQAERLKAGGRALQMLDILQRRNVRPDLCRAWRGRIFFAGGDYGPARAELDTARAAFAALGRVDATTSLLLGLIAMRDERWPEAETVLAEAAAADTASALAWRSLGVAHARAGHPDAAARAMDRALGLDRFAVAGWYNRGLLRLQQQQFPGAVHDLERARQLDPDNREVQRLLQMAAAGHRAQGGDPVAVVTGPPPGFSADPDTLLARLESELAGAFSPPDSLRADHPGADQRLADLETEYLRDPRPATRELLAAAYLDRNLLPTLQALLAPGWGVDLSANEELMLLWADHSLGEAARAEEAARLLLATGAGRGRPWLLLVAADAMRTSTDPVGTDNVAPNTHGYFGWWRDARLAYRESDSAGARRPSLAGYAAALHKLYKDDPLFEQAVWGLPDTPLMTGNFSVGAGTGGRSGIVDK